MKDKYKFHEKKCFDTKKEIPSVDLDLVLSEDKQTIRYLCNKCKQIIETQPVKPKKNVK